MSQRFLPVVLAAGASRRMGRAKLFLPLAGTTLLRGAVDAAREVHPHGDVLIVTGAYDTEIREHLGEDTGFIFVHNPRWADGMSTSVAAGVNIARLLGVTHYLIMLADQPSVDHESLAALLHESRRWPGHIVATRYPERLGVPAVFPAAFSDDLVKTGGAFGARHLIAQLGDEVRSVSFPVPPADIDTWEDYLAAGGDPNA